MLLIFRSEAELQEMSPAQGAEMTAAFGAYTEALQKAGNSLKLADLLNF